MMSTADQQIRAQQLILFNIAENYAEQCGQHNIKPFSLTLNKLIIDNFLSKSYYLAKKCIYLHPVMHQFMSRS